MNNATWNDVVAYNRHAQNLGLADTMELIEVLESENIQESLEEFIARRGFDENATETRGFSEWIKNRENN